MFEVLSSVRSPSAHAAAPGLGTCQTTRRASAISRGALARRVARNRLLSRAVAGARRSGHVQHNFHQQGGCARGGVTHQGRCRARHHRRRLLQGLPSGHLGIVQKSSIFPLFRATNSTRLGAGQAAEGLAKAGERLQDLEPC
jgi:hypothetical protein